MLDSGSERAAMKIGYAILAHDHPLNAARLARHLLEAKGTVAIHFDAKRGSAPIEEITRALGDRSSEIIWARRVSVGWGEWSMIEATVNTVSALFDSGKELDYIHLMSGADYPIRPIQEFEAFLDRHRGVNFTESYNLLDKSWVRDGLTVERFQYRHYFNYKRHPRLFGLNWKMQRAFGIRRKLPAGLAPHFGSQWCTLTAESWKTILEAAKNPAIVKAFNRSWIPDEMFIQTVLSGSNAPNSNRHLTLYQFTDYGVPLVFCNGHAEHLSQQPFFFARKISPYATRLRDEIDLFVHGKAALPKFQDSEIGKPTSGYENFRARNKLGIDGRRIPGYVKDPWYGDLEWNRKPYIVFVGTSDEELDYLAKNLDTVPGIASHGRLFARDKVYFAKSLKRLAGYGHHDNELRNHKPTNFLSDIIHARPDDLCSFAMSWTEAIKFFDIVRFDRRSHVVLVKGSPLRAFLEEEAQQESVYHGKGEASSHDPEERKRALQAFFCKHQDYYARQQDRLEQAKTRFTEIDIYDPAWRHKLATFLAEVPTLRRDQMQKALHAFSVDTTRPVLADLSSKAADAYELSQLTTDTATSDRQAAELLAQIKTPYLVVVGPSAQELSIVANAINTVEGFELHGDLFATARICFAGGAKHWKGYAEDDTNKRDDDPVKFLKEILDGSTKKLTGFCISGLLTPRIFDLMVHDGNARIVVLKGDPLRALAGFESRKNGKAPSEPRWVDPQLFEQFCASYSRYYDELNIASADISAIMTTLDLSREDWVRSLSGFIQGITAETAAVPHAQIDKKLAVARTQLQQLDEAGKAYANIAYLKERMATRDEAQHQKSLPRGEAEKPAKPRKRPNPQGETAV